MAKKIEHHLWMFHSLICFFLFFRKMSGADLSEMETKLSDLTTKFEILNFNYTTNNEILAGNLNNFFLIVMGCIVFLMQAGFAFLEAGAVRSKNTVNILIKNMLDALIGGVSYWAIGKLKFEVCISTQLRF